MPLSDAEQKFRVYDAEAVGKERHYLVDEWENLIQRVRSLPQFNHFLRPAPFHQLCQAATGGQAVIVNASMYGAHALIFEASHQIQLVPLPNADIEQLSEWLVTYYLIDSCMLQKHRGGVTPVDT